MCKYRIITFDGGGIRGLLSAVLLKRLNDFFPKLIQNTNMFAGTSVGSFLALGLAYGLSPEDFIKIFTKDKKFIFSPSYSDLCRPKYNNEHLIKLLNSIFPKDLRLIDLNKHVLIPSFQVISENSSKWKPIFYNNFPNSPYQYEKVIDVALCSSAAPGYFPSYKNQIDGGVIANNPSTAAISIAVDKCTGNKNLDEIHLLSIGTGLNDLKITADTSQWGELQWNKCSCPPNLLQNIMFDGSIETNCLFSSQLLGNRYFRLNPHLSKLVSLDSYNEIPYLHYIAQNFDLKPAAQWIKENWFC